MPSSRESMSVITVANTTASKFVQRERALCGVLGSGIEELKQRSMKFLIGLDYGALQAAPAFSHSHQLLVRGVAAIR